MSILDKLTGNARQEVLRAPRLSTQAARHTMLDEWVLNDLKRASPKFRGLLERPIEYEKDGQTEVYQPSAAIHDDIFLGAHTPGESRVKDAEAMRPSHRWGRNVLDEVFKTEAWKAAQPHTEGDALTSAVFTRGMLNVYDDAMREDAVRDQVERSQDAAGKEEALEQVLDELANARQEAKDTADAGQEIPEALADKVKDLTGQREHLISMVAESIAELPPNANGKVPGAVKQAIEKATEAGKERADVWSNVASLAGGALDHATPDEAYDLAEAWMQVPDFKELIKLMGRLVRELRALDAKNVIGGNDDIVGIEFGNNLTATLPSELGRLGNPLTQRSFLKDFMDEQLLQFQTQGIEKADLGPGVLCLDMSGSMHSNSKATHAKAVTVAYVRLMHKRKRDAVVIVFNQGIRWTRHFPKDKPLDMAAVLELASLSPSGQTSITTAVAKAEDYILKAPAFKRADVLVVTDGQSSYDSQAAQIRERFEQTGVRSFGIGIGHTPAPGGWLTSFCDHSIGVTQLTEATADIVRAVS